MNRIANWSRIPVAVIAATLIVTLLGADSPCAQASQLDTAKIEQITGLKGTYNEAENVFKVGSPRTDVRITVAGVPLPPFAGLTTWAAFQPGQTSEAMVMGDLVLFQDEVNPVMDAAFAGNLTVTALHNHFFYDEPRILFMHIAGEGDLEPLATGVRKVLDAVRAVRAAAPEPAKNFGDTLVSAVNSISDRPLEDILGVRPEVKDGVAKFTFGRTTKMSCGCTVGSAMGVNTWAAFLGSDNHALVDGDFACLPAELQSTLKALRKAGINVVAIHNHMEGESPRVMFLHYWGLGAAQDLANGIKSALDAQAQARTAGSGR